MSAFTACCRACSRGLYSCRWKRSRKGEESQERLRETEAVGELGRRADHHVCGADQLLRAAAAFCLVPHRPERTAPLTLASQVPPFLGFAFHLCRRHRDKSSVETGMADRSSLAPGSPASLSSTHEEAVVFCGDLISLPLCQATAPFLQLGAVWALVLLSPLVFQGCQAAKTKPGPREHHHVLPKEHRMRRDGLRDGRAAQGSHGNPISIQACLLWPANPRAHIDKHPFPPTFIPTDNLEWPMKLACFWNFSMHVLQGAKLLSVSQRQGTADMLALDASAGAALIGGRDWRFKASIAHIDTVLLH
uniref:uncharacterized protein LOC131106405 isoform X2 n=1 Tax=Doryrhamphus excisus TaxID=161450 RepID=UPI0025AE7535|nr:uncharacterized protein LOC131106405 isoform X2 [Doryrhamphus excisus]